MTAAFEDVTRKVSAADVEVYASRVLDPQTTDALMVDESEEDSDSYGLLDLSEYLPKGNARRTSAAKPAAQPKDDCVGMVAWHWLKAGPLAEVAAEMLQHLGKERLAEIVDAIEELP